MIMTTKQKQQVLLDAFGDNFVIIANNGGYCLYDKTRYCKRANAQYIGKFYLSNAIDKYIFQDRPYESVESLVGAMDKYNTTLPFSPEVYDPTYRPNHQIEMAVYDYITSLGFKRIQPKGSIQEMYELNEAFGQKVITIELITNKDTSEGIIRRWVYNNQESAQMIDAPFKDLESAIGALNSLLAAYCSMLQVQMLNMFKNMTTARCSIMLDSSFDMKRADMQTKDARQETIEFLEQELKRLKE